MAAKQQAKASAVAKKLGIDGNELAYLGEGLWARMTDVTPALATEWLKFNEDNRSMKERSSDTIADDIKGDRYRITHQGIAFGYDGKLKDGQNRLNAVIKSDKTIRILVFIGLDDDAKGVVDTGVVRTNLDAAKFAGIEVTKLAVSASKICEVGMIGNTKGISNTKALELIARHKEAYDFVKENLLGEKPQRGIAVSSVCAGLMRAYYACKDQPKKLVRLKKFCTILQDGQYGKIATDIASFRLREMIQNQNWSGSNYAKQLYRITEEAIVHFLAEESVKKLKGVKEEAFPLPGEIPTPAAA
jgi:hypothetical protein